MTSLDPELVIESLSVVFYAIAASALTIGGIAAEYASTQHLGAGDQTVALWLAAIGAVMIYAGVYGLGYQKLLVEVQARLN
ncbi:hypothetical protein [Halopiger xanaduensis]|uniref:DUF8151 domain-containing protein n=1 Tax=Halopiger xanaduensis (strain DSM 18323 / JCM 14033 / SH-6) TaxID=797210 RepID=F8DB77_HALXS|nr:hypothetical protein [Halopiger xanaduensis]AEH35853.1 hypothetical protein Halxa_1220 [Halopiger xanaduensis SH-6]